MKSPVESCTEDLLPMVFRAVIVDVAERMQVPMDYPAAALIVALGGAISRRAAIQPKAKDTGWIEVANLYGGIVGEPGFLKSPVINAMTRRIAAVEKHWHEEFLQQLAEYKKAKDESNGDQTDWPKQKRVLINDATFEKLQLVLSENQVGVIVCRDELTGLLDSFERKGHEGERQFYLTAWNGYSPYNIDRIERGTIYLPAACLSVLGGIQPGECRPCRS